MKRARLARAGGPNTKRTARAAAAHVVEEEGLGGLSMVDGVPVPRTRPQSAIAIASDADQTKGG